MNIEWDAVADTAVDHYAVYHGETVATMARLGETAVTTYALPESISGNHWIGIKACTESELICSDMERGYINENGPSPRLHRVRRLAK